MAFGTDVVTLLKTDATLVALLTGGIYEYPDTGRKGLTRLLTESAFSAVGGLINPTAVVLELDDEPDGEIVGLSTSVRTPIVIFIYDSGMTKDKYTVIETAHNRIRTLLHLAPLSNACQILYDKTTKHKREPDLKDAAYWRATFYIHSYWTVT
jgi:hypothetical protein